MGELFIPGRRLIAVNGADGLGLLQRVTSNDLAALEQTDGIVYTLLLTPQGRYQFDFFVVRFDDRLLLDVPVSQAEALLAKLNQYKLRADVAFEADERQFVSLAPEDGDLPDPRQSGLGWRCYSSEQRGSGGYEAHRISRGLVEPATDMQARQDMPLDFSLETLNAISFSKGCYPGQELVARMHNRKLAKYEVKAMPLADVGDGTIVAQSGAWALVQVRRA